MFSSKPFSIFYSLRRGIYTPPYTYPHKHTQTHTHTLSTHMYVFFLNLPWFSVAIFYGYILLYSPYVLLSCKGFYSYPVSFFDVRKILGRCCCTCNSSPHCAHISDCDVSISQCHILLLSQAHAATSPSHSSSRVLFCFRFRFW